MDSKGNPGLPDKLWAALYGRLWHATGLQGLKAILVDGQITIQKDRYRALPLCHYLGCVSLFDFGPSFVHTGDQFRNWRGWFGNNQRSPVAVWLEINRRIAKQKILDAGEIRRKFSENPRLVIPGVEAGHQGPIPTTSLKGALLICRDELEVFEEHLVVDEKLIKKAKTFEVSHCWSRCQDPSQEGSRKFKMLISQVRTKLSKTC